MKRAVDCDNRAELADWLASTMERAYELADIAGAALKPKAERVLSKAERVLSKAELRRELEATFAELRQLCRAGRRGIRTPSGKP